MTVTLPVAPNAVECIDCDDVYIDEVECPEDPDSHAVISVFVTKECLGVYPEQAQPDAEPGSPESRPDLDFWHYGRERYEYSNDPDVVREVL